MTRNKSYVVIAFLLFSLGTLLPQTCYAQARSNKGELHLFNWENYLGPTTIKDFEKESGIKVYLETYEDEDQMLSVLQGNPGAHDLVVAADDTLRELQEMRLIQKINFQNIPNFKNIDRKYRNPYYDPTNSYSVPYLWGTTGLAVNRKHVPEGKNSWSLLFDPRYKGKIAFLNNPDEVLGVGLLAAGFSSANSNKIEEIEAAGKKLLTVKELQTQFLDTITIRDKLISGELWVAQVYSGEGLSAADENSSIEYFIPKEGAYTWVDVFAIPRDAANKENAELFINYVLEPKVSAKIANYLWYANCNIAARPFTLKEILTHPSVYPTAEEFQRLELFDLETDRETQRARNKVWSQLQK